MQKLNNISKKKVKKILFCRSNLYSCFIQKINEEKKVDILINKKVYTFKTCLIGKVQIKNLIFAIVAAYLSNIKINDILNSIKK